MRNISLDEVTGAVSRMCVEANYALDATFLRGLQRAEEREESALGKEILGQIIENAKIASEEGIPLCQDTGTAVFLVELGEGVRFTGDGGLLSAINKGVSRAYRDAYLRSSIVADPLRRKNTGDNTPPVVHIELIPGEKLRIMFLAKGSGCENMSAYRTLTPTEGIDGVKKFVCETMRSAGGNPCPPVIVGIGIGGNFERCAYLSKKALFRPFGTRHPDPFYADLEEEILREVNRLGIGPMGVGGSTTALDVHIETFPCHIASLPVSVNIDCHSHRNREIIL